MRTTLPAARPSGADRPAGASPPTDSIQASLERYLEAAPTPGPRLLPELGTTRNDWPAHRQRPQGRRD